MIRICALALAALIAFKGIQALVTQPVDVGKVQAPLVNQLAEKDRQIAKLIDLLNDKRTTPAPPGSDQELKKVVVAIDEGAKVDPRYAQALELLKAGKPSEAEPLLKAVAEDKVKSADNANRDAAAAFRNLASIAAVSDPAGRGSIMQGQRNWTRTTLKASTGTARISFRRASSIRHARHTSGFLPWLEPRIPIWCFGPRTGLAIF